MVADLAVAFSVAVRQSAVICNLYSVTKSQAAIRELARMIQDQTGNMPPLPGISPDYGTPIVREGAEGREMVIAR